MPSGMPALGTTCLYRPVPRDFDEMFVQLGWGSICEHYQAHWRTVTKWIDLRGRDRLRAERAAFVATFGRQQQARRIAEYGLRRVVAS